MKILIIGAGVTGSLFASYLTSSRRKLEKKLKEKVQITILARGETYKRLRENGLKIHHVIQDIITIDQVDVIKSMESSETYDYVLVFLRKTQVADLLPSLSSHKSGTIVFAGNNGRGTEDLCPPLSPRKALLAFAGVGGRRDGDTVYSVHGKKPSITIGTDGPDKKKIRVLKRLLGISGISVKLSSNMDSWLKYHLALVIPLALAVYRDGGDNVSLSRNRDLMKKTVKAIREGFKSLRRLKYPVRPWKLRIMMTVPDPIIRRKLYKLLSSRLGKLVVYDHCMAAPEEMKELSEELRLIIQNDDAAKENLNDLLNQNN